MYKKYAETHEAETLAILKDLCLIPAPSYFEDKRVEYCKNWFESIGASDVYVDEAKNVILPVNCEGSKEITVFVAHTDTVFPDTEPMPYVEKDGKIFCPGVGDDTASVAVLMILAKYLIENGIKPEKGALLVCNSCEEGLGNLKGTRQVMKDYEGRISKFVSFDASFGEMADVCVGSHRYEVEVRTKGGHSFGAFGNKNAIAELSKIISEIYKIEVPQKEGTKTTYNVGIIEGGTSVNTIAQTAKMLCEYRSDDLECLAIMEKRFNEIFENAKTDEVEVVINKVGDRPCGGDYDKQVVADMAKICAEVIEEVVCVTPVLKSGSTDCNIPLSMGIPAICIGVYMGGGAHTREEWIEKSSIKLGIEVALKALERIMNM